VRARGLVGAARSQRRASTSSGRAPALDGTHSDRDAARRRAAFARPSGQQARA